MAHGKNVFIVGPGFIGWEVIDLLIAEGYSVKGLVRRQQHADGIKASGAEPLMGDLDDKALITEQTTAHDIIIHTATADHLPSVEAVLDGVKARAAKGQPTIFIHTSGTSVLNDDAAGAFKSDKIYYDRPRDDIDSVSDNALHREVDLAIVNAQKELKEKAKLAIMIPPLIYGFRHGRGTIQIPTLTRFALKHGYSTHVGKGLSVESNIHVCDLARAYIFVLHCLERSSAEQTLENPYYFCETTGDNEPTWYDVASVIGEQLHKAGKIQDPKPRTLPEDLYQDVFGEYTGAVIGLNSRSRAVRLRQLGWEPKEKSWRDSYIEDELPEILKEDVAKFAGFNVLVTGSK